MLRFKTMFVMSFCHVAADNMKLFGFLVVILNCWKNRNIEIGGVSVLIVLLIFCIVAVEK